MKYFEIGKIVNTQGVRGEVRVIPITDDSTRFELLDVVEVVMGNRVEKLTIEHVRYHKQFVLLQFKEIPDMTAAEKLKGSSIRITEDLALPLGDDEYYWQDLYGLTVITTEGERIGELTDIITTGANDVYAIQTESGKQVLIPAIKQCIKKVDIQNKNMIVEWMEGL